MLFSPTGGGTLSPSVVNPIGPPLWLQCGDTGGHQRGLVKEGVFDKAE